MTYPVVSAQQSLFDIAIEVYGDVQGVHWLVEDNATLNGNTDRLYAGQVLQVRDVTDRPQTLQYLTDFTHFETIDEQDRPVGIDYWRLNDYLIR